MGATLRLKMFALFERLLKPAVAPETPEPPPGLVAFYWHFARQAKPLAGTAKLGADLVVQTPYGDSGQTTFFVASQDDWGWSTQTATPFAELLSVQFTK